MIRFVCCLALTLGLSGCATYSSSIPDGYSGPQAQIEDSITGDNGAKANFFVVETIDGAKTENSLNATLRANAGRGMTMKTVLIRRPVVAERPLKLEIRGRTQFAAPILAIAGSVYQVKGTVEFTPKANTKYIVRGKFTENYSSIWVEDAANAELVGSKIEVNGSAKLGLLEK